MEVAELQQQLASLRVELRKEQEENCQILAKAEILELEIQDARESEKKMFESLIVQTKQLEQTKISLEEAKLEMKHLNDTIQKMEDPKEIQSLRVKLTQALEAEGKSRKAMDYFAIALKEVTTESNRAKKGYFQALAEVERLRAETERLRLEVEESFAAWRAKENGFINCMKIFEEEIAYAKQENQRLMESERAAREEISNLRDIVKQAVKESNIVKQALEIARKENSWFKDLLIAMPSVDCVQSRSSLDIGGGGGGAKPVVRFPSDNWALQWNSTRDSKLFEGSIFDVLGPLSPRKENDDDDDDEIFEMRLKKKR